MNFFLQVFHIMHWFINMLHEYFKIFICIIFSFNLCLCSYIYRVKIIIGARQESEALAKVISNAIGPCQQDSTYTPPDINGFFQPAFTIDWCNVSMVMQINFIYLFYHLKRNFQVQFYWKRMQCISFYDRFGTKNWRWLTR